MTRQSSLYKKTHDYVFENAPRLPYHNAKHAFKVAGEARRLAIIEWLDKDSIFLLEIAGLLHDIVYNVGSNDNEEKSMEVARGVMPKLGFKSYEIDIICRLIMATKWPTKPRDRLEKIICDADVANFGSPDFFEYNDALIREMLDVESLSLRDRIRWYERTLDFLMSHRYYTQAAIDMYGSGKEANIKKIGDMIKELKVQPI